jgi:hypothetical protein
MFHDKPDTVTAFSASKTLENVTGGGHIEGGRFFMVERAKSGQVASLSPQGYEILDDLLDPGAF